MNYRYRLERGPWMNGEGTVVFVMLNPSTATQVQDDPTIRRCVAFAQAWGFAWLKVGNLYALRATDPRDLFAAEDPVGPENDRWLARLARSATEVIVAWGASPHPQPSRARHVLELVESHAGAVRCLGQTQGLHPRHPCRLSRNAQRVPFKREATSA
jgi:hypothetical protein